jgi:hypothetical protein
MPEHRLEPRFVFGGVAEITTAHPETCMIVSTGELSRHGCFVRTRTIMPVGTKFGLKISHNGKVFNASGEVIYVLSENGMGIKFAATAPDDAKLLEVWLWHPTKF